jgi:hypothetical protein
VYLPVLGVAAAHDDFNHNLIRPRFWDWYILNSDLGSFGNNSFLHLLCLFLVLKPAYANFERSYEFCSKCSRFNDAVRQRGVASTYITRGQDVAFRPFRVQMRATWINNDECGVDGWALSTRLEVAIVRDPGNCSRD